jgi:hypothetical protein
MLFVRHVALIGSAHNFQVNLFQARNYSKTQAAPKPIPNWRQTMTLYCGGSSPNTMFFILLKRSGLV